MNPNKNSNKSFQFAIITIVCFGVFIVFQVLAARDDISEETYTYASSFFVSLVFVAAIASFVSSIKGLKEPISVKKIIGLSVNALLILLLIAVIVANVMDF
ncbi:hypothetical protein ES692_00010 [Psychroserpens burtonensis]|uniref:Uncharacterized protein n=1 Tax=Psychroserpens burtonensis TaxID=49278 RepID=A0A5C7BDV4_9FLAO|nr:hypothetical protein [Psychroserpens burtonensis]TXE20218.1 hypothetical protein ES692_00010 [Psychroserpens burtonensis]